MPLKSFQDYIVAVISMTEINVKLTEAFVAH